MTLVVWGGDREETVKGDDVQQPLKAHLDRAYKAKE